MTDLSTSTIEQSCKLIRGCFPSTLILAALRSVTGDESLTQFPHVTTFESNILRVRKADARIPLEAVIEMTAFFYREREGFFGFLKYLTSQSIQHDIVPRVRLDEFISKVNVLLLRDSQIRVTNYEMIQKWVPNEGRREVFLNIDVPEHVEDYFAEALSCLAHDLHRSCILFCTFALEASLRFKYADLVDVNKAYKITFNNLIDWGVASGFIEQDEFNRVNIEFIRKYRNDLAHFNMNNPDARLRVSRSYAQKMSNIVVHLVEYFINNIFY